ncbi:hypothetical protein Taro_049305 [Colocasia esculenta]|uniref:Uncharacterized protein n=1 Tax=Colocasia esculenta TaxID=4460 RepID=A0A843XAI9_COLES|nr:hypothetical protein [Colocasia esculenta]
MVRRSFSHGCSVSLVVTPGCSFPTSWRCVLRLCFCIVFSDSASFAGVVVVASAFVGVPTALAVFGSVGGGTTFRVPGGGCGRWLAFQQGSGVSCRRVLLLLMGACAASVVDVFARAAVGFVLGLCVWVVVCSRSSSLLVLVEVRFPQNCVVLVSDCCGVALWVEVHRLAACVLVEEHRLVALSSSDVSQNSQNGYLRVRGVLFVWLVHSGGFSQSGALVVLVEVVFLFIFEFLGCTGGTSCVPVVGWFALLLVPCVLYQMGVWAACPVFSVRRSQLCLEMLVAVWYVALSASVVGAVPYVVGF